MIYLDVYKRQDIVSVGSCVSNDRTLYKSRTDTRVNYALLVGEG